MSWSSSSSSSSSQRLRIDIESVDSGIQNEQILILIFKSLKWDIHALCQTAAVNRKLRALANRLLWRELCLYKAPRMIATLTDGTGKIGGGWQTLGKLLFFCGGWMSTAHFKLNPPLPGHFINTSRFSKTSGQSFLLKKCREDVLYVSDPCEHKAGDKEYDVGIYRGVFRGFTRSKTREYLIKRHVQFEETIRCPYCGARVWSMTAARLIPRKNAARRLGSFDNGLDYFVCLNGHMHGACWLVPLSSDEDDSEDDEANTDNSDDH
ncbi:EID1-like F-box protein 3 [Olea europaea var. sylvestris]|uniref:EID1-like F-box protein 3 n=1 Tax=Olea europaea var. sylvestris TaxID=158386 RepID=UPI000C1D2ED7|nr:EID1-like F-box protein 3 [Olea europaea var. sylvestris]